MEQTSGYSKNMFRRHTISSFPKDDGGFPIRNRNEYIPKDHAFYSNNMQHPYLEQNHLYGMTEETKNQNHKPITLELAVQNEDSFIISRTNALREYIGKGFQVVCKVIVPEGPKELIIAAVQIFDKIKVFWADIAQPLGGISVNREHLSQTFTPLVDITIKKQVKVKPDITQYLHNKKETPSAEPKPSRFMTIYKKKEPESIYPAKTVPNTKVPGKKFEATAAQKPPPTPIPTEEKTVSRWKTLNKTPNPEYQS